MPPFPILSFPPISFPDPTRPVYRKQEHFAIHCILMQLSKTNSSVSGSRYIVLPSNDIRKVAKLSAELQLKVAQHCMVGCSDILPRDIGEISRCNREISTRYLGAGGGEISERICSCRARSNLLALLRAGGAASWEEKHNCSHIKEIAQLLSPKSFVKLDIPKF